MSDLILNLRIGVYHLQIRKNFKGIKISKNMYFVDKKANGYKFKFIEFM